MKNAQMAQSPLVLIGGAAATLLKGRGALQDVEQIDVLRSITKYHASVRNVREIVPILRRAFHEAMSGVPGPVFVEIPIDCLYCIGTRYLLPHPMRGRAHSAHSAHFAVHCALDQERSLMLRGSDSV